MCYPCGSADPNVKLCPMCKVFPHPKCPHRRDICRNRNVHPRFDVMFLKNAEVDSFNGCGWCKWANFLQQKESVPNNHGWPGCCRAPQPSEYRYISVVDWKAVSVAHNIAIPADVKAMLDSISGVPPPAGRPSPPPAKSSPIPTLNTNTATPPRSTMPSRTNSFSKEKTPTAVAFPAAVGKSSKSSPKQIATALGSVRSANGSGLLSSSPKSPSTLETHHGHRHRQPIPDFGEGNREREKERRGSDAAKSVQSPSPFNTNKSLDGGEIAAPSPKRVLSIRRNSGASSNAGTPTKTGDKPYDGTVRRRSPMSLGTPPPPSTTRATGLGASSTGRTFDQHQAPSVSVGSFLVPRSPRKEDDSRSSSGSSDGPSGGSGSLSDSTVTSDGGFTDYLSDESEAELQRQAEAKAALLAQNQVEEMEFKAARQRLAHVDLQPPKTWNPTNITNTGSMRVASSSKV